MKFAIQKNLISERNLKEITEATETLPREFVEVIPFTKIILPEEVKQTKDWIPYGSTLLTSLASELQWRGCYSDLTQFNYKSACENRSDMLNDGFIMPIKEAIKFLKAQDPRSMWFTRPSLDLKQYTGEVNNAMNLYEWFEDRMLCESSGSYKLEEHTEVVISVPREVYAEWRWFIVDRKIVSGSMYRYQGYLRKERVVEQDVIDEAQSYANGWLPHPCCVMDLALVSDGLKVVEFNTINSSGFYDNDVKAIMSELYKYTNNS